MRLPVLSSVALLALPLATTAFSVQSIVDLASTSVYTATGIDVGGIYKKLADAVVFSEEEDAKDGVVRLTDLNYEELMELEDLKPEQEEERVWCVLVHGAKGEPLTQLFWDAHAEAANTTKQLAASNSDPYDLSHVTFARVDYINVTEITSRWMIWKPPYLVFANQRGQELRFLTPRQLRPDAEILRKSLANGDYKEVPVWTGKYAPGGWAAPYLKVYGHYLGIWNKFASKIPRIAWLVISGFVSQTILSFMHKNDPKPAAPKPKTPVQPAAPAGSNEAKALAEAVRGRAAAKAEKEKLDAQNKEAERVVKESEAAKLTAAGKSKAKK